MVMTMESGTNRSVCVAQAMMHLIEGNNSNGEIKKLGCDTTQDLHTQGYRKLLGIKTQLFP